MVWREKLIKLVSIFLLIAAAVLMGKVLADDISTNEDEKLLTIVQGYTFASDQSIAGDGLASIYRNYATVVPDEPLFTLHFKGLSSGGGNYYHNSSIYIQNRVKNVDEGELSSSNWKIEQKDITRAVSAEMTLPIGGSFKVSPISSLWKDRTYTRNYGGNLIALNYLFDRAKALDKESNINMYTSEESFEDYRDSDDSLIGISMGLKASFNGTGHIGMEFGPDINSSKSLVDKDYRGSFSLADKISIEIKKKTDYGDDDTELEDYPWMPCCMGGFFNMSETDRRYIDRGIFTGIDM